MAIGKPAFRELTTPFLRERMAELAARHGPHSEEYQALARQYCAAPEEQAPTEERNLRHYEADVSAVGGDSSLLGVERLYRRTLVVEPTLACAAHCRYCIRANYPRHNLSEKELLDIARSCGAGANREDLTEVLVTGGDPLLVPERVDYFLHRLAEWAPNIRVVRIATRIPAQDPGLVTGEVLRLFENRGDLRLEVATQINHRVELFPEVVETFAQIMKRGARVYAQNVLLRGVNDRIETLVELYDVLRRLDIEAHYLFHCVPLKGMGHLRTSLQRAIDLGNSLACNGAISGRAKPMLAAMTDVGKVMLYDGVVLGRDRRHILLQTKFRLEDRRRWNPGWQIPKTAEVDRNGSLRVWYLDGDEAAEARPKAELWPHLRTDLAEPAKPSSPQRVRPLPAIHQCG